MEEQEEVPLLKYLDLQTHRLKITRANCPYNDTQDGNMRTIPGTPDQQHLARSLPQMKMTPRLMNQQDDHDAMGDNEGFLQDTPPSPILPSLPLSRTPTSLKPTKKRGNLVIGKRQWTKSLAR
jgi:hypothetical protein